MSPISSFQTLGLAPALISALAQLGYEMPTPVQAESIPILLAGNDLLAQAQTGTGKTAAFALPILSQLTLSLKAPQALVIAPTRELAIQVAEAFQSYARQLPGFHVAPIYGGQDYKVQLRALKRGAHIVVGTPGRLIDHLQRGTLSTQHLKTLVLDEADEMLKMGFIEDIEWILEQIPVPHQTALFSATLPTSIQHIAQRYMHNAQKVHIQTKTATVASIEQCYVSVVQKQKLAVLTRFLEVEDLEAAIIFSRTKLGTTELAEKLQARGYAAAALNGDMPQSQRKQVVDRIKKGSLDIVIATDVAARGLDIDRISHVINYDIPYDTESYVHRIGRTGRAGRKGKALLFVTPREQRLLKDLERTIKQPIKPINPPSVQEMQDNRSKQLASTIASIVQHRKKLIPYYQMVEHMMAEHNLAPKDIAAALASMLQQATPLPTDEIAPIIAEDQPKQKKSRKRQRHQVQKKRTAKSSK